MANRTEPVTFAGLEEKLHAQKCRIGRPSCHCHVDAEFYADDFAFLRQQFEALRDKWRKSGAFYEEKECSALGDTLPTPGTVAIMCADDLDALLGKAGT